MTARERLRADLARYFVLYEQPPSRVERVRTVLETEAIWAIATFRFGQYLHQEANAVTRRLLSLPHYWFAKAVGRWTGIHLFPETPIGPGLYIGHYGGIWISPLATLGANCNISQGVVIGVAGTGRDRAPILGDRVWVGPNAVITGPVKVGSGAVIAAASLVTTHIPENAVAIGVPTKILSYTGSANLIRIPEQTTE